MPPLFAIAEGIKPTIDTSAAGISVQTNTFECRSMLRPVDLLYSSNGISDVQPKHHGVFRCGRAPETLGRQCYTQITDHLPLRKQRVGSQVPLEACLCKCLCELGEGF